MVLLILKVHLFRKALTAALKGNLTLASKLCYKMNSMLNQALLVPEQISTVVNSVLESAVVSLQQQLLMLSVIAVKILKALISFVIELYLGTFTCLCIAFIKGTIDVLVDAIEEIVKVVDAAVDAVITKTDSALSGLSTLINTVVGAYEAIKSLFSDSDTDFISTAIDTVNLTVSSLENISIPTTFIDELESLSSDIPDFQDVLSNLSALASSPVTDLQYELGNLTTLNSSLSVANIAFDTRDYDTLSSTCASLTEDFETAIHSAEKYSNFIIVGLATSIVIILALVVWLSFHSWKKRQFLFQNLSIELNVDQVGNILATYENGFITRLFGINDPKWQWLLAYSTTPVALNCLLLAIVGLVAVGFQYLVLSVVSPNFKSISSTIDSDLMKTVDQATTSYLNATQYSLDILLEDISDSIVGSFTTASTKLYDTLVDAETSVNDTITSVFRSSVFASPLRTIVYCTIGRKLETIDDGLTWIINNLQIDFPILSQDELHAVIKQSVNSTMDSTSDVYSIVAESVDDLIKSYKKALFTELIISCVFAGIWLAVFFSGVLILLARMYYSRRAIDISAPQQLTQAERYQYSYPFSDPFHVSISSKHSHG